MIELDQDRHFHCARRVEALIGAEQPLHLAVEGSQRDRNICAVLSYERFNAGDGIGELRILCGAGASVTAGGEQAENQNQSASSGVSYHLLSAALYFI